jgi:hypothetical protein
MRKIFHRTKSHDSLHLFHNNENSKLKVQHFILVFLFSVPLFTLVFLFFPLHRWHIMKRANLDKTVAQLYLKDWSMKSEISRKAQMYEHTIMHRTNDCKSNIEDRNDRNNENMKMFTPTPLHHENANALLQQPHCCNRSGVYISSKGTNFCDIIIPSSAAANAAAEDPLTSLKMKHKIRRNKKILKLRKSKEIFHERLESMMSIDKL